MKRVEVETDLQIKFFTVMKCIGVALGDKVRIRDISNNYSCAFRLFLGETNYITIYLDESNSSIVLQYKRGYIYSYSLSLSSFELYTEVLKRLQMIIHRDDIIMDKVPLSVTKYRAWTGVTYIGRANRVRGFTIYIRGSVVYVPRVKDKHFYDYLVGRRNYNIQKFLSDNTMQNRISERSINFERISEITQEILADFIENILYPLKQCQ